MKAIITRSHTKVITKKQHSEDCFIKGTEQLYFCFERVYYGNFKGKENAKQGSFHKWFEFRCNMPECVGLWIIEERTIVDFIIKSL